MNLTPPQHIAIIMDGNGRWARQRNQPRVFGHRAGTRSLKKVVQRSGELGIKFLTVYVFSSENWERPPTEVHALMSLLVEMLHKEVTELNEKNVKLSALGSLSMLPPKTRRELEWGIKETANNTGLQLNLAVSYGGRKEIVDACASLARKVKDGELTPEEIDEELFQTSLYQPHIPDPELLIRTGGDMRVSNFLLWQIAYTELFVSSTLWPDFDDKKLEEAIEAFHHRQRRFGRVMEI